jgi:hypothetical protein
VTDAEEDAYYPVPSFHGLCTMAREALTEMERTGAGPTIECRTNENLRDSLQEEVERFWANWSIVTGVVIPEGLAVRTYFGCPC